MRQAKRILAAVLVLVLVVVNVPLTVWAEDCADGHHYEAELFASTCTEDGFTVYICSECGDTYLDDEIAALGHQPQDGFCIVCGIFMPVEGVYEIYNAEQLYLFAELVNSGETNISGKLMADITVNTGVLTEDGKLNGDGSNFLVWTPIGTSEKAYTGSFDGNGKTIAGLYLNDSSRNYVGLFGYGSEARIANVGVVDSYLCGGGCVGGILGFGYYGTISNCYNTSSIRGGNCVGGVAGDGSSTASNCRNSGSISGRKCVGGIVGNYANSPVSNCYNTGCISGSVYVGGIAGYADYMNFDGPISNCYNAGSVSGIQCVGGIAGYRYDGTIRDCYNIGIIGGVNSVGGITGYDYYYGMTINCYNIGFVTGGGDYVGGIAGYLNGTIRNCYNANDITGRNYVGGITGNGTALLCYNTGNVSGTEQVGGVAGYVASGKKVSGCYSIGSVTGSGYYVGGVVGKNEGTVSGCYYIYGNVKDGNGTRQFGIGCETLGSYVRDVSGSAAMKSKAAFASGEVCYLLQQAAPDAGWGQEIGVDASPVLGGATVYPASDCKGEAGGYSNIEGDTVHDYENAICVDCGECYRSGDIKWQLSSGASMEDAFTDLRLISYVDTLADYSKVVFTVSFTDASGATRTVDLRCTTAYTELVANGASIGTADGLFGEGANYFVTYTIKEWPQAYFDTEITVIMTRYDLNGEVASVAARTFAVSDGM